jgi:ABC-type transport system involved in multi-copper enzyme maturation permease subunit
MNAATDVSFWGLCGAEWRKIRGRGLAWAVLLFGLFHGLLAAGMVKGMLFLGYKAAGAGAEGMDPVDWLVGGDLSLFFAVFPVNGFALLLLASILWAEDFSLGTMAMIFVRPVARWKVFASKAFVAWLVGMASILLALFAGLGLGALLLGFSADTAQLAQVPIIGWMAGGPNEAGTAFAGLSSGVRMWGVGKGLLASMLLIGPAIAIPAFVAALTRSPIWTLSGSIAVFLFDSFVWAVTAGWGASNLRGADLAGDLSRWTIWGSRKFYSLHGSEHFFSDGWLYMLITLGWTSLFAALALWMFVKRDVT